MSLRERKKQQLREEILATASVHITRHGFHETNMRAIADDADISHQTLYNYFPTKAALVQALLGRDTAKITAQLTELFDKPHPDLPSLLTDAVTMLLEVLDRTGRTLWREVTAVSLREPGDFLPLADDYYQHAQQRIGAAIAEAKLAGELVESLDTKLMAQILYRIIDHACLEFIVRAELTVDEMVAQVVAQLEMLIRPYLLPPPPLMKSP